MFNWSKILCTTRLFLIFFLGAHVCASQLTDNFNDGDFTSNPVWTPDNASNWTIDNNRLRSNSLVASSSFYITSPSTKALTAQWEFYVNLQFNTSSANFVDVFLTSDLSDLSNSSNNGYFVRIGGTPDEVSLYKLSAGVATILINGTDNVTNVSNSTLKIKVIRDANHQWSLERDATGSGNSYVLEGIVTDNSFVSSNYFGIRIQQSTASFFTKHYFDDFYVGDIILDTDPPQIASVIPTSSTSLTVEFNEKLDAASAQTTANYSVNNGTGQPISASLQPDEQTVILTFAQSFSNAVTSQLTVTDIKDLLNNSITSVIHDFFFFQEVPAEGKDIIITEIFADPSPVIGLPEAEFVEIYNRSANVFNLQNWKLTDGNSVGVLPQHYLYPNQYVILSATSTASLWSAFGTALGVTNFPTLNNSGDQLTLSDNNTVEIDHVNYLDTWYRDDDKKQGGYSLELIDVQNPCGEEDNWVAAESTTGGTPGAQNSVWASKPDLTGPKMLTAIPISSSLVVVRFHEKLSDILPESTNFVFTPALPISGVAFTDGSLRSITLALGSNLQPATTYLLTVSNVYDCNGNALQSDYDEVLFGLPEEAEVTDIVINEILFNPRPTGIDFVEIYNRSDKFINLKNWSVANLDNDVAVNHRTISSEDFLLSPGEYLLLTENGNILKGEYINAVEERFYQVADLPSFNDDEGSVAITTSTGEIIDSFLYTDDFHSVFLRDDEGVSLERISPEAITHEKSNWKSASATAGYATPGYVNSNSVAEGAEGKIVITPEIFEPVTGTPDFTQIHYTFEQGGFVANIKILDFQGREIKEIANNTILGTTGFFRWDGDTNDGTKARAGYYIVWAEVFNNSGSVSTFRKRVVVAAPF